MLKYYQFSFLLTALLFSSSLFCQTPCNGGFAAVSGGEIFIDISIPLSPTTLGDYSASGYTHDAQVITYNGLGTSPEPSTAPIPTYVSRGILIVSNGAFSDDDKIVIIDVTGKNNVVKISEISYSQPGYAYQGWFTDDHRYFILGDEKDKQTYGMNTRTLIFGLPDLDNPVLFSTYSGPLRTMDHNGYIKGNTFFMANYRSGMRILNIPSLLSAPNTTAAIAEIGYFDTYPANDNTNYGGVWSVYPYFSSGNIIIGDIDPGLFIVRKSGTLSTQSYQLDNSFQLAPNPTKNNSTITSKNNQLINSVEIYTILGKKIFEEHHVNLQKLVLSY